MEFVRPVPHTPNDALTTEQIPASDSEWAAVEQFALSFDAYQYCASGDLVGDMANRARKRRDTDGVFPPTLTELRICLFYEQRRWRHFAEIPAGDDLDYLLGLLDRIRESVHLRDENDVPVSCRKCEAFGLRFERRMYPEDFIEGSPDARVWIIGLNPAGDSGAQTAAQAHAYFDSSIRPYFSDFRKVLPEIYDALGQPGGTAHTDLVKCWSSRFPPPGCKGKETQSLLRNCAPYLEIQVRTHHPDVLICNGAAVSAWAKEFLPPARDSELMTSYTTTLDGRPISVVLTGFIGRIDDYSKARLGREIQSILAAARA